jgi:ABC-type multidrug transport system fused ATPase/permease subunit
MSRVQDDVGEVGDFLDSGVFWVAGEFVSLIAIIIALFSMNLTLALLTLTVVPLLVLFIALWQTTARRSFIRVRQALAPVNAALQENISGVRVIQSLSREDLNSQHFEKVNHSHFAANVKAAMFSVAMMPGVELLLAISTVIIVFYGGSGVLSGTLLVGTLLAFILYMQNFFDPIRSLTMEYSQLQMSMASGARVFELLDVKPEMAGGDTELGHIQGDIRFEHVSFSYESGVEVLHNIDLHIPKGKTVALVGPTGAGKSTIISLIARFYDIDIGRILIDGHNLQDIDVNSYRRQLGLVLQDPFLFSGTVRDNIRYGNLQATEEEITAAAKTVGAHNFILRLEKG